MVCEQVFEELRALRFNDWVIKPNLVRCLSSALNPWFLRRLQEEVRLLRATLAQRESLIRDLREGVDTSGSTEEEKKILEIR